MTRIRCRVSACVFWEQGVCGAEEIEYEPDEGCLTFQDLVDLLDEDEDEDDLDWGVGTSGTLVVKNDDDDWDDDWDDDDYDL